MGQVRTDILNGWKEIGAYVCRDIRTVERWEKHRGLPIRRVPGTGRATVYAIISELDRWLENTPPEVNLPGAAEIIPELPEAAEIAPDESTFADAAVLQGVSVAEYAPPEMPTPGEITLTASHEDVRSEALTTPHPVRTRWMTGASLAITACLLVILVLPLVRSRANLPVASSSPVLGPATASSGPPYPSKVAGVDDLYLRGVYFCEQRTPESLQRSKDDFSAAIAKDPGYAPAYAGLANTYNLLREYSMMPDAEAYPKAQAAAEHAIALDPKLAQAHASLGFINFFWSWDTVKAEREFRTALALDPSSVLAHHWYGSMLIHEGRFVEAIDQLDIAQRLEPASAAILSTRALALGLSGHRDEAMDMLQEVIQETPGVSSPHAILAILSKVQPRDPGRFLEELRRVGEMRHSEEMLQLAEVAEPAYRSGGERKMWESILETEERLHGGRNDPNFTMVDAEAALGRTDDAFTDLKKMMQRRNPEMIGIKMDPVLFPLQQDQRYGQLVASMGLPPQTH